MQTIEVERELGADGFRIVGYLARVLEDGVVVGRGHGVVRDVAIRRALESAE